MLGCNTVHCRGLTESFFVGGLLDKLPGVLEFDYVSTSRPPETVAPVTDAQLALIIAECGLHLHNNWAITAGLYSEMHDIYMSNTLCRVWTVSAQQLGYYHCRCI